MEEEKFLQRIFGEDYILYREKAGKIKYEETGSYGGNFRREIIHNK